MPVSDLLSRIKGTTPAPINGHAAPEAYIPNPNLKDTDDVKAPDFPVAVFPKKVREVIENTHRYLSYPTDFTAASILAATSVAVGRTHRIHYAWKSTGTLYLALVAPPGTAKSHPLSFALKPIMERDKDAVKQFNAANQAKAAEGEPADAVLKKTLYGDFTIETLIRAVSKSPRGIAVYLDELRAWFQNFNRYNSGSEQEFWLLNWSDSSISFDRKTSSAFLEAPGISVVGTIQPSLLEDIGKGGRSGNGFVERMLFCYPERVPILKLKRRNEMSDTHEIIIKPYRNLMHRLLDYNIIDVPTDNEDDRYHNLHMTPAAWDKLTDYLNDLRVRLDEIENENLRNVYAKMQTYTIRFALLLHLLHYAAGEVGTDPFEKSTDADGEDLVVGTNMIDKAIALTEYFILHALKANNAINSATPLDKLPRNIRNWYRALPFAVEFTAGEAETAAEPHKICRATVYNYLRLTDPVKRIFTKIAPGKYERTYF